MPELLAAGRVYKAMSPLYKIDSYPIRKYYKGDDWTYSKKELYNIFNEIVVNTVSIGIKAEDDSFIELSKPHIRKFLEINAEYLMEYNMLIARTSGHEVVLEYAAYYRYLYKNDLDKFKKAIEARFPEVTFDISNQTLIGSYERSSVSLFIDNLFDSMAERMNRLFEKNDFFELYYKNRQDDEGVYEKATIGEFFRQMRGMYNVSVDKRFKGLGEAGDQLLFITTINPKLRRLIRLTIDKDEDVKNMLTLFHGKKDKFRKDRREVINAQKISYADIDT